MNNELTFLLAVLVAVLIVIAVRKTKKNSDHYDERQMMVRGRAYQIGFMATLIFQAAYILLSVAIEELSHYAYIWNAVSMFLGLTVFALYSIWNDAFFALKQNPKKYLLLCIAVVACNSIGIMGVILGDMTFSDLIFSYKVINALCALSFLTIACTITVKMLSDRKEQE